MENGIKEECCAHECCSKKSKGGCGVAGGGIYCLGLIGAAVFYIQSAVGAWGVVLAILKAIAWPAFVVYGLLGLLAK